MTNYKPPTPSPQFVQSTEAAIAYWRKRTQEMDESTIRWLDTERQNLFQAVQFSLALPHTWRNTADVALQAFDLVERRGYWEEWIPVLEQAAAACTGEHRRLKIELLSRLGQLQRFAQQLPAAVAAHHEARTLAQQLGDKQALAIAHYNLSEDYLRLHDYAATERYGRAALTELDNLEGVEYWEALVLGTLGEMARFRGDLITSEEMLSHAVTIRRQLGQPIPLMRALNNLVNTLQTAGKFNEALQHYKEASELLATTPYELDKIMIQVNLGALYSRFEQWAKAEAALRQVNWAYLSQSNKLYYEAAAAQSLGNVLLKQGKPGEAISYLQRAVTLWQTIDEELEQANSMGTLGEALVALGRVTEAISLYKEAVTLLKKFPDDARAQKLQAEFEHDWQQLVDEQT